MICIGGLGAGRVGPRNCGIDEETVGTNGGGGGGGGSCGRIERRGLTGGGSSKDERDEVDDGVWETLLIFLVEVYNVENWLRGNEVYSDWTSRILLLLFELI